MMRAAVAALIALLALAVVPACGSSCPRDGCDATAAPAPNAPTGIAGAIAYETDSVSDNCQACDYATTTIGVWNAPSHAADLAAAEAETVGVPLVTFTANGRYEQALAQGSYVLCTRLGAWSAPQSDCAAFDVVTGQTTTVNAKLIFGPTQFTVFEPGASASRGAF
jgi:hypothetical protein